jgi:lysophospholipase L1-like esterase
MPDPTAAPAPPTPTPLGCASSRPGPLTFLALGDSYTVGAGVAEAERWPNQLADLLRAEGLDVADPVIVARTGWTTRDLAAALDRESPQGSYDLVSLLIGVNNQYRGLAAEDYRVEFAALLDRAIALADGEPGRVLVLSIPDWGAAPFAEGEDRSQITIEVDRFNAISRAEAERRGARYVDVTPISRQAATDPSLLADDDIHPSGAMYARWAELALPEACAALAAR